MSQTKLDLNLFHILVGIYQQGSVSKCAEQLHLTQPAVSHSLAKLRDVFADPLFVRRGHRMIPTAKTRSVIEGVSQSLQVLEQTMQPSLTFDPVNAQQRFVFGLNDVLENFCLPKIVAELHQLAPAVELQSVPFSRRSLEQELRSGRIDFALDILLPVSDNIGHQRVTEERLVVLARPNHGLFEDSMTLEKYLELPHIQVSSRQYGPNKEDFELSRIGLKRHVVLRCQHYLAACRIAAETDYLVTMPESYAQWMVQQLPLVISSLPMEVPPLDVHLYWHESAASDPAQQWMRSQLLSLLQA